MILEHCKTSHLIHDKVVRFHNYYILQKIAMFRNIARLLSRFPLVPNPSLSKSSNELLASVARENFYGYSVGKKIV